MIRSASLFEFVSYYRTHSQEQLSDDYISQLQNAVKLLERFHGGRIRLEDLTDDMMNRFCDWLTSEGRASETVRNRRNSILCLWRAAFLDKVLDEPPKRIRRIRGRRRLPEAWTRQEVAQLLAAARDVGGRFPNGISRSIWWSSLIHAGWDSALRLGDLLRLQVTTVSLDRPFIVRQHKTDDDVLIQFSEGCCKLVRECLEEGKSRSVIWEYPYRREALYRFFKRIVKSAKIRPGTFRYLRRGAITSVETLGGDGSRLAGHRSRDVTVRHYIDQSQLVKLQPRPEALLGE